jgi:MFS family permease
MSLLTLVLIGWVLWTVPDFPGLTADRRLPIGRVFAIPGVKAVLFVTLAFVLAHNVLYTYIAPFLVPVDMGSRIDVILLVFGVTSLLGIWIGVALFLLAAVALALWGSLPAVIYASVIAWGLAFGGAATLFQTASARAAGDAADVAQSMLVTAWNTAIAGGGLMGGILLDTLGASSLPWALVILLIPTLLVTWQARRHGFPPSSTTPCYETRLLKESSCPHLHRTIRLLLPASSTLTVLKVVSIRLSIAPWLRGASSAWLCSSPATARRSTVERPALSIARRTGPCAWMRCSGSPRSPNRSSRRRPWCLSVKDALASTTRWFAGSRSSGHISPMEARRILRSAIC